MARPDINFSMQLVESCWAEIESINKNIIIGCIYRHPKANIEKYTDELDELLKHLNQRKYQVVLLGDVNISDNVKIIVRLINYQSILQRPILW